MKASSMMVERVFVARLDGPDRYMVARRKERKTAAGAGTAVEVVAGLEKMANSAVGMVLRDGADGTTVTAEHKALLDDVAVEQGRQYQITLTSWSNECSRRPHRRSIDGPDRYLVARRKQRKTAAGAGLALATAADLMAIPNHSNTHTSFGAWSPCTMMFMVGPVHARARRADRVAR